MAARYFLTGRDIGSFYLHALPRTPVHVPRSVYNEQDAGHRYKNLAMATNTGLNCNNYN